MAESADDIITALPERAAATATKARRTARRAAGRATAVAKQAMDEFSDEAGDVSGALQDRVTSLREQLGHLTQQMEEFTAHSLSDARDLASGVGYAGAMAARGASRQAAAAARAVRNDPLPMVAALGVLALLAAFVISRNNH